MQHEGTGKPGTARDRSHGTDRFPERLIGLQLIDRSGNLRVDELETGAGTRQGTANSRTPSDRARTAPGTPTWGVARAPSVASGAVSVRIPIRRLHQERQDCGEDEKGIEKRDCAEHEPDDAHPPGSRASREPDYPCHGAGDSNEGGRE